MPIALPAQMLEIAGADAIAFAQAQFCNDVVALPTGHWQWNAWLSPQGRVRCMFILLRDADDRLRLLLRGGDAEIVRAALARFVFRAKLSLRTLVDTQVLGCNEAEALASLANLPAADALVRHGDSVGLRLPGPAQRWLLLQAPPTPAIVAIASAEALNRWRLDDIRAGLPELGPALEDQWLPQWLGLGRLRAISVRKGCYPGQEVMARLHFKGGNKRGLYRLQLDRMALPAPGTPLFGNNQEAGAVVMSAWSGAGHAEALAVLADTAAAASLCIGSRRSDTTTADEIKVVSGFAREHP
ncbi:MAG: folate-binding protein [Rudaea sp.]|nr:folate-binding protein [Rudaea sp.]